MIDTKKAISPVVAVALLLVVAVSAVVGFSAWYNSYSSELLVQVEDSDDDVGSTQIRDLQGNELYFNSDVDSIIITSVTIGGTDCEVGGSYSRQLVILDVSTCTASLTERAQEVVVVTNRGVFSKQVYLDYIS